ncbi:class I SAM-dependent methyltransferase [Candidatus Woesearchaeota archaeon]|jgi:cyclopropane fatty-acyl-phospholipid synthase-like methyltransferase|nr:class I SAM-dependent methyltransferase [Candidatus Woesearchaeota archaeon]MBT5740573.1 class I SAM-dependent methyltransferase [Candidatus Woesearchaeota archaeon]
MKNKEFFYLQYNKLKWENQEKTKINSFVNDYIIKEIIIKNSSEKVKMFDIGFGIGFFFKMLTSKLGNLFKDITLEGCEPSNKNFNYFKLKKIKLNNVNLKIFNKTFLETKTETKFDFITSIYTFTAFVFDELEKSVQKIHSMLNNEGKFIMVVSNEAYLRKKLDAKKDLFIEKNTINYNNKKYTEFLHYSEIPKIGTIIDYNREEELYVNLFENNGFKLEQKKELDDNGFICTIFVFSKI